MKFDDKKFLAEQIKEHREKAGLTQYELAEKINICGQHVSRIESARYFPSLQTFFKMAKVLGLDLKKFGFDLTQTENPTKDELIQSIINANDTELVFYKNAINAIDKSLSEIR